MSIFTLSERLIQDYSNYVKSFLSIQDESIRSFLQEELIEKGSLWPEALLQLNPAYERSSSVSELCSQGLLHPLMGEIFFDKSKEQSFRLYRHQQEAITRGVDEEPFIVTSGTGSGKSLTYFIPIFDYILKNNPEQNRVQAIVVYPMNALVNSQEDALDSIAESYKQRTGKELPVRYKKYTGQERSERAEIQQNPPHILLTNYVMLELMMVRPDERNFVDRTATGLQFLILDELHTYRGRQGADIALLVRRLKERCGNPDLLCIGTSATMVSGKGMGAQERRQAVADFGSKIFGVDFKNQNVVEEKLQRLTPGESGPDPGDLRAAIRSPQPETAEQLLSNPLTIWIELTFGVFEEPDGNLRRKIPIGIQDGAHQLAEVTGIDEHVCEDKLREFFLLGTQFKLPDDRPVFAFKLHHFIAQGRSVYATLEKPEDRYLTLEGQYYAPGEETQGQRILYPLIFCRVCGQEYYAVLNNQEAGFLAPWEMGGEALADGETQPGYLMLDLEDDEHSWNVEHIPAEWFDNNGRIKQNRKEHIPQAIKALPDGSIHGLEDSGALRVWYQPKPFLLCLNCGEFYSKQGDKNDFRKLTRLSSEGRSTTTTLLSVSAILNSPEAGIEDAAQKLLSFTDNRQDASLQAGHFNDFVQVSFLRAAIYAALESKEELFYDDISKFVMEQMNLSLLDIAKNKDLDPSTRRSRRVWDALQELIEYQVYEDLRRGWRVVQPNLEQCGLLKISYEGLDRLCSDENKWRELPAFQVLQPDDRKLIIITILDHFRKKLAVNTNALNEMEQQQLRKRLVAQLDPQWLVNTERMNYAERFLLSRGTRRGVSGLSLSDRSLLGRYLCRELDLDRDGYSEMLPKLMSLLNSQGLVHIEDEGEVEFAQLDSASLIWRKGDGSPPPPDPVYSRQADSPVYAEANRQANAFFREFYQVNARRLKRVEGREHTAQVNYEDRQDRENRFILGTLKSLFCSPTMELGVDIRDLQMVHMRNVPPTPANYAQRSGRAGRGDDPALVMTYCSAYSGHDQYFFRQREQMVAGAVRAPRLDLSNEDLIKAHVHAIWLAKVQLRLGKSITDILEIDIEGQPLNVNVRDQIELSENRKRECLDGAERILKSCGLDSTTEGWYSREWLDATLGSAPKTFNASFNRWRELYQAAQEQWETASELLRHPIPDRKERENANRARTEAERQKNLLCNFGVTFEETDFYPYRYLASEGFLPGYNFPRLPIRAFIPRRDGEFISRPRFIALTEFGPQNIIYHEGSTYRSGSLIAPPGGLEQRRIKAKICWNCGYFHTDREVDLCQNCDTAFDASNSELLSLLEMSNVRTYRRERITSDEEERWRMGYDITTHFRFAPTSDGRPRVAFGDVIDQSKTPVIRLQYAPTATLSRISHGWRNRKDKGYLVDLLSGEWLKRPSMDGEDEPPVETNAQRQEIVRLTVQDTENILLFYSSIQDEEPSEDYLATLQYAIQRGIETTYQVEESELASERLGREDYRGILLWEAAEGGVGVLRRLVEERDAISQVARAALERLHFDPDTLEDLDPDCVQACYECLLSYRNQRDHKVLNRHLVKEILAHLMNSSTFERSAERNYDEHYQWLRSLTDSRSDLERKFIDQVYRTRRRLPDEAQKQLADYASMPDFFYESAICVFCDGSVHDEPTQMERDKKVRAELENRGYRVIVIRYDRDLEDQMESNADIFGSGED